MGLPTKHPNHPMGRDSRQRSASPARSLVSATASNWLAMSMSWRRTASFCVATDARGLSPIALRGDPNLLLAAIGHLLRARHNEPGSSAA